MLRVILLRPRQGERANGETTGFGGNTRLRGVAFRFGASCPIEGGGAALWRIVFPTRPR